MTTPEPLVSDTDIANEAKRASSNSTVQATIRSCLLFMRSGYEHDRSAHLARIAKLELDSTYLNEVAGPAIDEFQRRDREQKARIAELEAKLAEVGEPKLSIYTINVLRAAIIATVKAYSNAEQSAIDDLLQAWDELEPLAELANRRMPSSEAQP